MVIHPLRFKNDLCVNLAVNIMSQSAHQNVIDRSMLHSCRSASSTTRLRRDTSKSHDSDIRPRTMSTSSRKLRKSREDLRKSREALAKSMEKLNKPAEDACQPPKALQVASKETDKLIQAESTETGRVGTGEFVENLLFGCRFFR